MACPRLSQVFGWSQIAQDSVLAVAAAHEPSPFVPRTSSSEFLLASVMVDLLDVRTLGLEVA
jgi:hypothetical protein